MAEESDLWLIESLAGFLSSPNWIIPITDFMENKCSVFDDGDENKLTYTEIHQQYKTLVERLIENYMHEVGINEEQFLEASSALTRSKSLQAVFQPVLAMDDFQMFRSLMVQKNVELQLQALHVIKERNGQLPECLTDGVDVISELEKQEMKILQEVLRRSKEEYDLEIAHRIEEKDEVPSTSSNSSETQHRSEQQTNCINDIKQDKGSETTTKPSCKEKIAGAVRVSVPQSGNQETSEILRDTETYKHFTEEEDLHHRSEYLKSQRDKLQALKRDKTLKSTTEINPLTPQPNILTTQEMSVEEKKNLEKRKHLAEKLKEEVIKK